MREKKNVKYECIRQNNDLPETILSDSIVRLTGDVASRSYPQWLRRVEYWDEERSRSLAFLTNNTDISPLQVAELYRKRWQIELFFKWIKQHLRIKRFWGNSENAVRKQIYIAITTYCLVSIVQHNMQLQRSTYEVLQILSVSLTDKTPLLQLLNNSISDDTYTDTDLKIPSLFDC